MGTHIEGVAEYLHDGEWNGIGELPFISRPSLYYKLFGQHDDVDGVEPVAPGRGIPAEVSDLTAEKRSLCQIDPARVGGDEVYYGFGETWLTMDEFPTGGRDRANPDADDGWGAVLSTVEPYEDEYGSENVRLVVWFRS